MKRLLLLLILPLVLVCVPAITVLASQGPGQVTFRSLCTGTGPQGSVTAGQMDLCQTSVASGYINPYGPTAIVITVWSPSGVTMSSCNGGTASGDSCHFTVFSAHQGTSIGSESFTIPFGTPPGTTVRESANCSTGCSSNVALSGAGSTVSAPGGGGGPGSGGPGGTGPGGFTPPTPPFASASCVGPNHDGSVYPSQQDVCRFAPSAANTYRVGEHLRVVPISPSGSRATDCSGVSGPGTTTGTLIMPSSGPAYCLFTVEQGVVASPALLGTETIQIPDTAQPNTEIEFGVTWCSAPGSDGEGVCTARQQVVPDPGPGATVSSDPPVTVTAARIQATEGAAFNGPVGVLGDRDLSATADEYTASIDWGDGSTSPGTLTPIPAASATAGLGAQWTINGSHLYLEEGSYTVTLQIFDVDMTVNGAVHSPSASAVGTAEVADAPLTAAGMTLDSLNPFDGTVAAFSDADPNGVVTDYSATVDWGDGTSEAGTVNAVSGGFSVSGTHSYPALGPYTITVHVCDIGGACADASSPILVYGLSSGGNFVIGDGNAAIGSHATFWGSQWATMDSLSGGNDEPSFKGFSDSPNAAPACGTTWSTTPGNSAKPPDSVPRYMAVVVAPSVTKNGSRITGDTAEVVVMKTDAGYGPDPGQDGTGAVVAVLCP